MRLETTCVEEKKFAERLACAFFATLSSSATLSAENNENIDPCENDGALSGRFPRLRDLYQLHRRRRRRQRLWVFRRESRGF